MRFVELFGGIGGFSLAMQREGFQCVGYYEIDKYAVQTYNKNFGTNHEPKDIREVKADDIPEHEILCGGFPCQSFSIAGKRMGFEDTRGTLFFEIARIVKVKRPHIIFLENVKGLLSHDRGRTFATILATLDELGYNAEWQVLNSKYFGVPQNRERVFIIGHLRGGSSREIFPISTDGEADYGLQTITSRYFASNSNGNYISYPEKRGELKVIDARNYQNEDKKREYDNISPTLMARARTDETPLIFAMRGRGEENTPTMEINQEGTSNTLSGVQKDNLVLDTPYSMGNTKPNRSSIGSQRVPEIGTQERSIRRLTEIECERLQSFPDNWTAYGKIYKEVLLFGNVWNVESKNVEEILLSEKKDYALNITKDGENGVIQKSNMSSIGKIKDNVQFKGVIEIVFAENCVCDITNHGNDMVMLCIQKDTSKIDLIIKQNLISEKMEEKSTCKLLKITLEENSIKEKLSIISILTRGIIESKTFLSVMERENITNVIILWRKLELNLSSRVLLSLKQEIIIHNSAAQRYKQLGNAVTINVVQRIAHELKNSLGLETQATSDEVVT